MIVPFSLVCPSLRSPLYSYVSNILTDTFRDKYSDLEGGRNLVSDQSKRH